MYDTHLFQAPWLIQVMSQSDYSSALAGPESNDSQNTALQAAKYFEVNDGVFSLQVDGGQTRWMFLDFGGGARDYSGTKDVRTVVIHTGDFY